MNKRRLVFFALIIIVFILLIIITQYSVIGEIEKINDNDYIISVEKNSLLSLSRYDQIVIKTKKVEKLSIGENIFILCSNDVEESLPPIMRAIFEMNIDWMYKAE